MTTGLSAASASAEQAAVIEAAASTIVVSAAAGSGKTWTAAQRYLKHVLTDGLEPGEILCVTFTKKAASEMRSRILACFEAAGQTNAAILAEAAPIGTIHSLCERLIRENAPAAGIDPEFEVLASEDSVAREQAAMQWTIEALKGDPGVKELLAEYVGKFSWGSVQPYDRLFGIVSSLLEVLRTTPYDGAELRKRYASPQALTDWLEATAKPETGGRLAMKPLITEQEAILTCASVKLAEMAKARLDAGMITSGLLDYPMLERTALDLLSRPAAAKGVCEKYRALIVDEAQDLNPMQMALLGRIDAQVRMFVGDENQSIYGFRQAAPELFEGLRQQAESLPLTRNRRSRNGLLADIDEVFGKLWGPKYRPMAQSESFDLESDPKKASEPEAKVEVWPVMAVPGTSAHERLLNETASGIRRLAREGVPLGSIGALTRTWSSARRLKELLTDAGIPCRVTGGSGLFLRLESRDIANVLIALTDPTDRFALLAVLRGPLVDLSMDAISALALEPELAGALGSVKLEHQDDQRRLDEFNSWWPRLREDAYRLSAFEVIDRLICDGRLLAKLAAREGGEEAIGNIRKLLTIAARRPTADAAAFADSLKGLQRIKSEIRDAETIDEQDRVVTITTIHQAKGLEWPVVVLTDTDAKFDVRDADILIDRTSLSIVTAAPGRPPGRAADAIKKRLCDKEIQEGQRMLYVAMTRAADRLILVVPQVSAKDRFAEWLKPLTARPIHAAKAATAGPGR